MLVLYSVFQCHRAEEEGDVGRQEGEYHEEAAENHQCEESKLRAGKEGGVFLKKGVFKREGDRRRYKEKGDIKPIGRPAEATVIGVKENGNQDKPKKRSEKLYPPKILIFLEKETLNKRKNKKREEKQFHMLPG